MKTLVLCKCQNMSWHKCHESALHSLVLNIWCVELLIISTPAFLAPLSFQILYINPNLMLWVLKHLRTRWCDTQDCVLSTNSFWRLWPISLSSGQWFSLLHGHKARTPFHVEYPQVSWKPFCWIKPNQNLHNIQPVNAKQSPPLASFQVSALSPKQRNEPMGAPDRGDKDDNFMSGIIWSSSKTPNCSNKVEF